MPRHHRLEAARGSRTEVESPAVTYLSLRHPPPHPQTSTPSIFSHLSLGCETDKAWTSRLLAVRSLANGIKRCWRINPPKISCQRGRSTLSPCPRVRHFLDPACNPIGGVHLQRPGTTFQVDCLSKYTCVFLFCFLSYMYFAKNEDYQFSVNMLGKFSCKEQQYAHSWLIAISYAHLRNHEWFCQTWDGLQCIFSYSYTF